MVKSCLKGIAGELKLCVWEHCRKKGEKHFAHSSNLHFTAFMVLFTQGVEFFCTISYYRGYWKFNGYLISTYI